MEILGVAAALTTEICQAFWLKFTKRRGEEASRGEQMIVDVGKLIWSPTTQNPDNTARNYIHSYPADTHRGDGDH